MIACRTDIKTGDVLWQKQTDIFGGWLGYSTQYDILLQADWPAGDAMGPWAHEKRMITYNGSNGNINWDKSIDYEGPCILLHDNIITNGYNGRKFSILTGETVMRINPITKKPIPWQYTRNYGCNTVIAAEHLLTFRSAAAGYYDLAADSGTGNLGGFKSGCTSNLIIADGVLNAPDYTSTCVCSYQNKTSLALVHSPDVEMWTFSAIEPSNDPVKKVGINFAAPGDRTDENGTLWLDFPPAGGPSPNLSIETKPNDVQYYRRHASHIKKGPLKWVTASGAKGLKTIKIKLNNDTPLPYTVRLFFADPEPGSKTNYKFDIDMQNKKLIKNFNLAQEAKTPYTTIIKEFKNIKIANELKITLTPPNPKAQTIIAGIELTVQ
ncbi:MAG: hypothetical protein CMF63_04760 [Magnetovibrio sp.]|nr:hypothetical protein [Magnetovibrio sp.]